MANQLLFYYFAKNQRKLSLQLLRIFDIHIIDMNQETSNNILNVDGTGMRLLFLTKMVVTMTPTFGNKLLLYNMEIR